jgi:hypothetical protein
MSKMAGKTTEKQDKNWVWDVWGYPTGAASGDTNVKDVSP